MSLDAILVLGGEGKDMLRSKKAQALWHRQHLFHGEKLPIILSGNYSGTVDYFGLAMPEKPESHTMREYLVDHHIPAENIYVDDLSLDTVANFICSTPLLDNIRKEKQQLTIGLVTENSHMERAAWTGRRVLSPRYNIQEEPADAKTTPLPVKVQNLAIRTALAVDLSTIRPGEHEKFQKYLNTVHPFHSHSRPLSAYKMLLESYKLLQ